MFFYSLNAMMWQIFVLVYKFYSLIMLAHDCPWLPPRRSLSEVGDDSQWFPLYCNEICDDWFGNDSVEMDQLSLWRADFLKIIQEVYASW